jgi:hypothetical protein
MTSEVLRKILVAGAAVAALSVVACKKAETPTASDSAAAAASDASSAASDAAAAASDAAAAASSAAAK